MAAKPKSQFVKIPNGLIRDPNLSSLEFVLLVKFKLLQYINHSDKFPINRKEHIKEPFGIADNRTIKKSLDNLLELEYIRDKIIIDSHSIGEVHLNSGLLNLKKNYTCIYGSLLRLVPLIDCTGVRLISYYESYINRTTTINQFCYTSIETITNETGLAKNTIIKYNKLLSDKGFISVDKHKLGTEYKYDGKDKIIFSKYNNHYTVNWDKIL